MPMTDRTGLLKPDSAWPGQECSCWEEVATSAPCAAAVSANSVILAFSPLQPPTRCRPMRVSGSSEATMTKNWSTSL